MSIQILIRRLWRGYDHKLSKPVQIKFGQNIIFQFTPIGWQIDAFVAMYNTHCASIITTVTQSTLNISLRSRGDHLSRAHFQPINEAHFLIHDWWLAGNKTGTNEVYLETNRASTRYIRQIWNSMWTSHPQCGRSLWSIWVTGVRMSFLSQETIVFLLMLCCIVKYKKTLNRNYGVTGCFLRLS